MKKLIVITGASSGIGEALAQRFSKAGHPLLLVARRLEKLEKLNLPNTLCKKVDVSDLDSFANAIKEAEEKYGKTDLLVNNAGVMLLGETSIQDPKEWKQMLDVNVMGLLNGIHCVSKDMKESNQGTIVNISSIAGRKTFPTHSVYCGTKFAVHAISEGVREELSSSNVRVITIAPGVVETELLDHTTNEDIKNGYKNMKDQAMDGAGITSDQVAQSIEFAYNMPQDVCLREIVLAKTKQIS